MHSMPRHFTIVIPSYNNELWVDKCLSSALQQDYDNYEVVYINDCSTDKTLEHAQNIFEQNMIPEGSKVISNEVNKKALRNLSYNISSSREDTIIVALDGDDWLPSNKVLKTLDEVYSSGDVWMTAGSYIDNVAGRISQPNIDPGYWDGNIRMKPWTISHLRTFRRELFMKIKHEDLLDDDEDFYKFTFDQAMMYPMAEMSGPDHFQEIKEVMYVYNRRNPISVDRVHRQEQLRIERKIRLMQPYKRIGSLYE